ALRAARRARARPDAAGPRRLEPDRAGAGRRHRYADRGRQRPWHRARPRARAADRRRRLPGQAVLDEGARRPGTGGGTARRARRAREDRPAGFEAHVHPDALRRGLLARAGPEVSRPKRPCSRTAKTGVRHRFLSRAKSAESVTFYSRRYIGTRLFSPSVSIR